MIGTETGTTAGGKIPIFDLRPIEVRSAYLILHSHLKLSGVGAAYDFVAREQFFPGMEIAVQAAIDSHRQNGRPDLADKLSGLREQIGTPEIFRRTPTYAALVELIEH